MAAGAAAEGVATSLMTEVAVEGVKTSLEAEAAQPRQPRTTVSAPWKGRQASAAARQASCLWWQPPSKGWAAT